MKQKIVFFGSGWFVVPVVEKLIPHGLDLVITTEKDQNSPLLKFCNENGLKTFSANNPSELRNLKSEIRNHNVAILASYGAFIPEEIIETFPEGIINIHPSLLPKYKGPSPIQYQLLNGETTVGVTLIKLDDEIDHGPILSQKPYHLQGHETSEDLLSLLFEIGANLVEEQVMKLANGERLSGTPQDHSQESWSFKITKEDGKIDPHNLKAKTYNLTNMIRAYYPWPGVWFRVTQNVIPDPDPESTSPTVIPSKAKQSKLHNKIIKLLPEGYIQVEGKKPVSYKDFINGFGIEGKDILKTLHLL